MTVHQTIKTLMVFLALHPRKFSLSEKDLLKKAEDGLSGMGDVQNEDVLEYLYPKQIKWIRDMGKRFGITEFTPFI